MGTSDEQQRFAENTAKTYSNITHCHSYSSLSPSQNPRISALARYKAKAIGGCVQPLKDKILTARGELSEEVMTEVRAYVNRKFGRKSRDINLLMARDESLGEALASRSPPSPSRSPTRRGPC